MPDEEGHPDEAAAMLTGSNPSPARGEKRDGSQDQEDASAGTLAKKSKMEVLI
jgi:hypothetical protein